MVILDFVEIIEKPEEKLGDLKPAHILTLVRHCRLERLELEEVHIIYCDMVAKGTLVM